MAVQLPADAQGVAAGVFVYTIVAVGCGAILLTLTLVHGEGLSREQTPSDHLWILESLISDGVGPYNIRCGDVRFFRRPVRHHPDPPTAQHHDSMAGH